jgi:hypothetical protein
MRLTRSYGIQAHVVMKSAVLVVLGGLLLVAWPAPAKAKERPEKLSFDMVVAAGAKNCLPNATGHVTIHAAGENQRMHVEVEGLPPHTAFTLFVLQVPTGPFGLSWYQGDIETDDEGHGSKTFLGIFSSETFVIAPAEGRPAPQTHPGVDAVTNPATAPVHTYHLGMWFSDPTDAGAAGCPNGMTPFDGDHVAGIQVLNTSNFPDTAGPLGQFE